MSEDFPAVLEGARKGAEWAWAEIYRSLSPKVLGYLRSRGVAEAEDLLGEVFLQVVRDLHRFSGDERAFTSWVFAIAHNRMLDDVRARARRPPTVDVPAESGTVAEPAGDVEREALDALAGRDIRAIIGTLSDEQQAVLLLRLFGDLTIPQIASAMGKSNGAVKALQRRGLKALHKALEEQEGALLRPAPAIQGR